MSSTFKGQESDISPCLHHRLPMSGFAKGNGTDGKSTRDEACFHSLPFLLCPPPPSLCGLARPPDNVNNQERELVSLCDLRLHDTMKGQRNKDMANISIPNI